MNAPTPDGLPKGSLIIPTRNRPNLIAGAVAAALKGDEVPAEIVVIDQSDDPHPTLRSTITDRGCEVRYLWKRAAGVSRARNDGIAAARHDILAFTDDDVLVTSGWYGTIVRALLEHGPRSAVTGRVLAISDETSGGYAPSTKSDERRRVYRGRIREDVLFPPSLAMFRSAFDEVGGFDTCLGAGTPFSNAEDNDLGFRLLEAGFRIVYEPDAVVYHRAWRNKADRVRLVWNYGHGQGAYYAKHLSLRDRFMLGRLCRDVATHAQFAARRIWRQPRRAGADALYMLAELSGATQWLLMQPKTR